MRGWADTGTVIARCCAAQAGGEIGTRSLGGVREPWEGAGDTPGDTVVPGGGRASRGGGLLCARVEVAAREGETLTS